MNRRNFGIFSGLAIFGAALSRLPFAGRFATSHPSKLVTVSPEIAQPAGPFLVYEQAVKVAGGTFTIQHGSRITPPIPWNATQSEVQAIVDRTLNGPATCHGCGSECLTTLGSASYICSECGYLHATNVTIKGEVTALPGRIEGWEINRSL